MHPIHRSEYFEPMSFFYGGISCFFHMNKDFFYWKTEKMPLENLWQFQKQNFEEIFKKHPLIVFRNNKKYVKSKKKQLSKLLKLSSHPTQYLTLSLSKIRVAKKKKKLLWNQFNKNHYKKWNHSKGPKKCRNITYINIFFRATNGEFQKSDLANNVKIRPNCGPYLPKILT